MKLKPCPFCGSSASEEWHMNSFWNEEFPVVCCDNDQCGARTGYCDSEEEAVEVWNKRHNEPPMVDEVPNLDSQRRETA